MRCSTDLRLVATSEDPCEGDATHIQDIILHAAEGQIRAVLRLTGLTRPGDPLAEVADAVCDTFGAVADITFQTRIYE